MINWKYIITIAVLNLSCLEVMAQKVPVKDPIFGDFLCEFWPQSITAACDSVKISDATIQPFLDGLMDFNARGIKTFDEAIYYPLLDSIIGDSNEVLEVPILNDNLVYLDLSENKITGFNSDFVSSNSELKTLKLANNQLTTLPDFSVLNNTLSYLNLSGNKLTFEDFIPLIDLPNYNSDSFLLDSQQLLLFPEYELTFVEGTDDAYSVFVDEHVDGVKYRWFKDGVFVEESYTGTLAFNDVKLTDAGQYQLEIHNSNFEGVVLKFDKGFTINVLPSSIDVLSPNGDGIGDEIYFDEEGEIKIINSSGKEVVKLEGPVIWDVTSSTGEVLEPGLYFLQFEDGTVRSVSILY